MIPAVIASASALEPYWKVLWWGLAAIAFVTTAYDLWAKERTKTMVLEDRLIPKLFASGHPNMSGCKVPVRNQPDGFDATYFRMVVTNTGDTPARKCQARLTRITKEGIVLMGHENRILTYDPGHHGDATAKTIYGKSSVYLNVLYVYDVGVVWLPTPEEKTEPLTLDQRAVFSEPGKYILSLELLSDDSVTVPVTVEINWTGNPKSSFLTVVESGMTS